MTTKLRLAVIVIATLVSMFFVGPSYAFDTDPIVTKSAQEKINETRAIGKRNTEIMIVTVTLGLAGLVGVGYVLQNLKKKPTSQEKKETPIASIQKTPSKKTLASLAIITFATAKTFLPSAAYAVCPVCVVGVGAALGLAEILHIDDTITGAWIGGMGVALLFWMADFMNKRKWTLKFKYGTLLRDTLLASATVYLIYLAVASYITNNPDHMIAGIDKMIVGPVFGAILFTGATQLHSILKANNDGKAYFPFQKVVLPIGSLLLSTVIFYLMVYAR